LALYNHLSCIRTYFSDKLLEEKIERGNSENERNIKAVQKDLQDIEQAVAEINRLTPVHV
jgi:gas vesicle protein